MVNERGIQRGKDFEKVIRQAFLEVENTTVERWPDQTNGFKGAGNKADFIIYHYPYEYYIECKTVHSHRMSFTNVTFTQRTGLLEVSEKKGVIAGLIVWFIEVDKTYFIPIQVYEKYRLDGEKSLNLNTMNPEKDGWVEIAGTKKRVFFDYDINSFIDYCTRKKLGEKEYK